MTRMTMARLGDTGRCKNTQYPAADCAAHHLHRATQKALGRPTATPTRLTPKTAESRQEMGFTLFKATNIQFNHLLLWLDINRNGSQGNNSKKGRYLLVNFVIAVDKIL